MVAFLSHNQQWSDSVYSLFSNFFGFLRDLLRYFTINMSFSPSLRKPNELFTSIARLRRDGSKVSKEALVLCDFKASLSFF